ncbi:uncharacterized protein [Macrobrachium rosenbergii]
MAGRLVIEVKQSVSIKYPRDSDDGKNVTQPVALTPQNGALAKEPVPNISRLPAVRTSSCQLEVPLTRTPKIVEVKSLSVTLQVSKPSANNSPVVSETQVARSYGSNTPVMRSSMDNTSPSAKLKCTSKDEMPHVLPVMTPKSDQLAPRGSKENIIGEQSTRTPRTRNPNSSKCYCTPKIPYLAVHPKSSVLEVAHNGNKRYDSKGFADQCQVNDNICETPADKSGGHQLDPEKQKQCDLRGGAYKDLECAFDVESEQDNLPCALVTEKGKELPESSTISHIGRNFTRLDSVMPSTDTSRHDFLEEFQKVVERVKTKRSTLSRRRSIQSFGGRKSFGSGLPMQSLTDQISNIDANLPYDTKVSHLIDISLREALRRLEEECKTDECLEDVRLDLITNSERIGSCTSYKVVDECKSRKKIDSTLQSTDEVADIKNKIKKLEEEYKCWKSLLKKRKRACLSAKRKFHEARSGEIKIEDDCKNKLTCEQQSILATRPDYCQYMKEVQMAQEKVFFIMQEVNHTTNLFSSFLMASKAVGDSCYFAIEEMFLGTVKSQPLKCSFETLMKLGDSPLS